MANSFGSDFGLFGPNSSDHFFSFKNLPSPVTRYHGQLSSYAISEETNDRILRKVSDGWTGGETDESDFIGRYLTNVERLIE